MDQLLNVDWDAIFSPQHSLLELFLRGTIMYLVIFVLLRVVCAARSAASACPISS